MKSRSRVAWLGECARACWCPVGPLSTFMWGRVGVHGGRLPTRLTQRSLITERSWHLTQNYNGGKSIESHSSKASRVERHSRLQKVNGFQRAMSLSLSHPHTHTHSQAHPPKCPPTSPSTSPPTHKSTHPHAHPQAHPHTSPPTHTERSHHLTTCSITRSTFDSSYVLRKIARAWQTVFHWLI